MKRSLEAANIEQNEIEKQNRFRRQNPVSCRFCRSKKLKCDRQHPCSSCVVRDVECVPAIRSNGSVCTLEPVAGDQRNANVIELRLKALEEAVFKKTSTQRQSHDEAGLKTPEPNLISGTVLPLIRFTTSSPTPDFVEIPSTPQAFRSGDATSLSDVDFNDPLSQLQEIHRRCPAVSEPLSWTISKIRKNLPSLNTAKFIFGHFTAKLNWGCHVIHIPTACKQLEKVYADLNANKDPKLSDVALVATIMSAVAYGWPGSDNEPIELGPARRRVLAARWEDLARGSLVESKHFILPTIESLQVAILMIHMVDSSLNIKQRDNSRIEAVGIEIKRRMWWYLASADWLLSFMSGPQYGNYIIHPDQMKVLPPTNLNDDEISLPEGPSHLLSEYTEMSYTLCKIKLAISIREIVDTACKAGLTVEELPYDQILEFDKKLNSELDTLPWFYQLDETSTHQTQAIETEQRGILLQRNILHFCYHTRICRLHRRYLARGLQDPHYAYNRLMCLRSARIVIQTGQQIEELGVGYNTDCGRQWIVVHHIFVATMILVVDYCSHRADTQADTRQREIRSCYALLERFQQESSLARTGLEHLQAVMDDWMRKSDRVSSPQRPHAGDSSRAVSPRNAAWIGEGGQSFWMDSYELGDFNSDPQWEVLFRDLESQPAIFT